MSNFAENTYAEIYRGSGRFTGRIEIFPNGPSNPTNWADVSGESEEEFWLDFEWSEHDQCHNPDRPDWNCQFCKEADWV